MVENLIKTITKLKLTSLLIISIMVLSGITPILTNNINELNLDPKQSINLPDKYLYLEEVSQTSYDFRAQGPCYVIVEIENINFTHFILDGENYDVSYGFNMFPIRFSNNPYKIYTIEIDPEDLQYFKTITVEPLFIAEGEVDVNLDQPTEIDFKVGGPISILSRINFSYNWLRVEIIDKFGESTILKRIHDTANYPEIDPLFYCLFIERGTYIRYDVNLEPGDYRLLLQGNGSIEYKILVNSDWDKDLLSDVDEIQEDDMYDFDLDPIIPDTWGYFEKSAENLSYSQIEEDDSTEGYFSFYIPESNINKELLIRVHSGEFKDVVVDGEYSILEGEIFIADRGSLPVIKNCGEIEAGWHNVFYKHKANYTSDIEFLINGDPVKVLKFSELRDTDGDGVKDLEEYSNSLNPAVTDTDEDGIPDSLDSSPLAKVELDPKKIHQVVIPTDENKDTIINIQIKRPENDYSTNGVPRLWRGEFNVSIYPVLRMFGNKFDRYHFAPRKNEFNFEWNTLFGDYSYYPLSGTFWKYVWGEMFGGGALMWYINDFLQNYYWIDTGDYNEFSTLINTYYNLGFRAFRMFPTLGREDHNSEFAYKFSEGVIIIPKWWYDTPQIDKKEDMNKQKLINYWRPNTNVEVLLKSDDSYNENGIGDPLPNPSDPNDEFYFVFPKPALESFDYGIMIPQDHGSKNDGLLDLRFDFVWLVTRYDDVTGETSLLHYYDFEENIKVQSMTKREISTIRYALGNPDCFIESQILWNLIQNPILGTPEEYGVDDDIVAQGNVNYFNLAERVALDRKNHPLEENEAEVLYIAGSYENYDILNKIQLETLSDPDFSTLHQGDFQAVFSSYSISDLYEDQEYFLGDSEIQGENKILYQTYYSDFSENGIEDVQKRASIMGIPIAMETYANSKVLEISQAQGINIPLDDISWDDSELNDKIRILHQTYIERNTQNLGIPLINFEEGLDVYKEYFDNRQDELEISHLFFDNSNDPQMPAELFQNFIEKFWEQIDSIENSLSLLNDYVTSHQLPFPQESLEEKINLLLNKIQYSKQHSYSELSYYIEFFQFAQSLTLESSIIMEEAEDSVDTAFHELKNLAINLAEEIAVLTEGFHEKLEKALHDNRVEENPKQNIKKKNVKFVSITAQKKSFRLKLGSGGAVCVILGALMIYNAIQEMIFLLSNKNELLDNTEAEFYLRFVKANFMAAGGLLLSIEGVLLIASSLKETLAKSLAKSIKYIGYVALAISLVLFYIDLATFITRMNSGDYDSLASEIATITMSYLGAVAAAMVVLLPAGTFLGIFGVWLGLSLAMACVLVIIITALTNDPHITILTSETKLYFTEETKLDMRRRGGLEVGDPVYFRLAVDNDGENPFYMRGRFRVSGEGWEGAWDGWKGLWDFYGCSSPWYGTALAIDYDETFCSIITGASPDVNFELEFQADYVRWDFWEALVHGSGWIRDWGSVREDTVDSLGIPALENTISLFYNSTSEFFSYSAMLAEFNSALEEFRYKDACNAANRVIRYILQEVLKNQPLIWYDTYELRLQDHSFQYPLSEYYLLQTSSFEEWFWLMYHFYDSGFRAWILSDDIEDAVEYFNYYVLLNTGSITYNEWLAVRARDFEFWHHLFSWGSSGFWMWVPKDWWDYVKPKVEILHQLFDNFPQLSTNIGIDWTETTIESDPVSGQVDVNLKLLLEGPDHGSHVRFEIVTPEGFSINPQDNFMGRLDSTISFTITREDPEIEIGEYYFDLNVYSDADIPAIIFEESVPFIFEGFSRVEFLQYVATEPIIPGDFFQAIEISNTGTYAKTINITIEGIPESFIYNGLYPDDLLEDIFLLEPGETRIALIINPPRHHTTSPGVYTYQFRAQDHLYNTFDEIFSSTFIVANFSDMDFQCLNPEIDIFDNEIGVYDFNITNWGNIIQEFEIFVDDVSFTEELLSKETIVLAPGESQLFTLTLTPTGCGEQTFSISAISEDDSQVCDVLIKIADDDTTTPLIDIVYSGPHTDGDPGSWIVTASDPESGIHAIQVFIDGVLAGSAVGMYDALNSLGPHNISVYAINADLDHGAIDQESSTEIDTIFISDDDINPPEFSNFDIVSTPVDVTLNFNVTNEVEGDDWGLSNINIFIDDDLILNITPDSTETHFSFTFDYLDGDWFIQFGTHEIRVVITDNDDDLPNDALTSSNIGTFETTQDAMMVYIIWELGELKDYIENALPYCFSRPLINSIIRSQCKVQKALDYYSYGCITKTIFLDVLAKASLELSDLHTYILLKHTKITEGVADYIFTESHKIRDHISFTMGAIVGNETALELANIIVDMSRFADNMFSEFTLFVALSIDFEIWRAVDELDKTLILMTIDSLEDSCIFYHLPHAICRLESAKLKVGCFLNYGCITEAQAESLTMQIDNFIERLNNLNAGPIIIL